MSETEKAIPANSSSGKAKLVIITGLSGSGKSVVAKCFEDLSYYTVDNLPLPLLRTFLDNPLELVRGNDRIAVVTDVRAPGFAEEFPRLFAEIDRDRIDPRLLFLETSDEVLVRRFSETRRPHPLADAVRTLPEAIAEERRVLSWLAEIGQRIDTSGLTPNQLRGWIQDLVVTDRLRLTLIFESFGYKGGVPLDADFVFDARCVLPNPHY